MYKKVNDIGITESHLQFLTLFASGFNREFHIREAAAILGFSPRTSQLVMKELEKKAVLESHERGNAIVYRLKNGMAALEYMRLAEQYKKIRFLEKNDMLREIAEKIAPHIEGISAIFGSYARGNEKDDSDIDIFVAGKCDRQKIREISKLYGKAISIKEYPMEIFEKSFGSDILAKEVVENHILLSGIERFVWMAMKKMK